MNMKIKNKKSGVTLMEMVAVIAAVALLTMLSLPAFRALRKSLVSEGATRSLINSTLATARAMAAEKRCYVGVRFQKAYKYNGTSLSSPNTYDVLNADQYMIFIMREQNREKSGNVEDAFRAVEGAKPIKLPENFGVMDMRLSTNSGNSTLNVGDIPIDSDILIDNSPEIVELVDTTTFSIVFSPSGRLVIDKVRCRNKDGKTTSTSSDTIFNIDENVYAIEINGEIVDNKAMFFQDDYPTMLSNEFSRRRFVIYERDKFKPVYENGTAYEDYLRDLTPIYVNPYTGQLIKNQ